MIASDLCTILAVSLPADEMRKLLANEGDVWGESDTLRMAVALSLVEGWTYDAYGWTPDTHHGAQAGCAAVVDAILKRRVGL